MTLTAQDIDRLWNILDEHGREQGNVEMLAQDAVAGGIGGVRDTINLIGLDCIKRLVKDGAVHPKNSRSHVAAFGMAFIFGLIIADMGHREQVTARRAKNVSVDSQAE